MARTILRTIDGKVIVRPKAPDYIILYDKLTRQPSVVIFLNEAGKTAWDRGEEIEFTKGHWDSAMDYKCLALLV